MNEDLEERMDYLIGYYNKYFYSKQEEFKLKRVKKEKVSDTPEETLEELDLYLNWVGSLR